MKLQLSYRDTDKVPGGTWSSTSLAVDLSASDKINWSAGDRLIELLSLLVTRLSDEGMQAIVEATFALEKVESQTQLLALSLWLEKCLREKSSTKPDAKKNVDLFLRSFAEGPFSEAPAYLVGFVNAVLNRLPEIFTPTKIEELARVRRMAITEYIRHTEKFLINTKSSKDPPLPQILDQIRAALGEVANEASAPSESGLWQERSLFDTFIANSGNLVHKLKAKDSTGRWAYYFVLILPSKEELFLKSLKSEATINLDDYGKVIASNYGEEPNSEKRDLLKKRYDFDV